METEGTLPHLQEPATCLYLPESDELIRLHTLSPYLFICIIILHLHLVLPSCLFYSGFSTETMYAFLFYCMYATSPFCHFLLDLITFLISGKKRISWSSSMCYCHQLPLTSSPLCMNILITLSVKVMILQTVMPWGTILVERYQHFTRMWVLHGVTSLKDVHHKL
jgi:hypothetical protein